ncbi:MAG: DMT family transporter [Desulfococcaceae bacterium]
MKSPAAKKHFPFMRILPYLLVAVAPLCWAGNIVLARGIIHMIPPVSLSFWRWTVAFLILLPFTHRYALRDRAAVRHHWKIMIVLSVLGISCFNTLLYTAVHTITAINGALIQTTMPAFIIIISLLLYKERVTAIQSFGVFLCIFGAALVVLRGDPGAVLSMSFAQGDVLMLIAVLLYALYTVLLRKRPLIHPLSFVTYTFGIGSLAILPLYVWEHIHCEPYAVTLHVILSVLYVSVFPSIVAYLCWNRGAESIGPNKTGLFINLIPVFASIMAILWLGEILRPYHVWGMSLIFGGMLLFNRR